MKTDEVIIINDKYNIVTAPHSTSSDKASVLTKVLTKC